MFAIYRPADLYNVQLVTSIIRNRPNFGFGFGFGASANVDKWTLSADIRFRPKAVVTVDLITDGPWTQWTLARGGGGGRQCAGPLSQTLDSLLLRAVGWADMLEDVWRTLETVTVLFCFIYVVFFIIHVFIIFNTALRSFMPLGLG